MKGLLTTTAVIEVGAGCLLLALPALAARLLFDPSLQTPAGLTVIRLAGCAIFSLGMASGLLRGHGQGPAGQATVKALLFYNCGVVGLTLFSSLGLGLSSPGLWPSAVIHAALAVWCGRSLWGPEVRSGGPGP